MLNWNDLIKEESSLEYYQDLFKKIDEDRKNFNIFPSRENLYKALELTPLEEVKVVIIGQDPYHEVHQACGLAFSVFRDAKIPPSLRNIYVELADDLKISIPTHGDLTSWAKQGVLLLNTVLTVIENKARSHHDYGWQIFTDKIIKMVNELNKPVVFILLGNDAKTKKRLITNKKHLIIEEVHPSPLSCYRGFLGSKIFSRTNAFLSKNKRTPIDWNSVNND